MFLSRRVAMILSCVAAIIGGIVAGPFLHVETFRLFDALLPHPNGHGWDTFMNEGIQGAFLMIFPCLIGAIAAQFLTIPIALSFFFPSRLGARICVVAAILLGFTALAGLLAIVPERLGSLHGALLYFGFPLLCMTGLFLRAGCLLRTKML